MDKRPPEVSARFSPLRRTHDHLRTHRAYTHYAHGRARNVLGTSGPSGLGGLPSAGVGSFLARLHRGARDREILLVRRALECCA